MKRQVADAAKSSSGGKKMETETEETRDRGELMALEQQTARGTLVIVGGHEDRKDERIILREVVRCAGKKKCKIVVCPVASQMPEEMATEYHKAFSELGVDEVTILDVRVREDALNPELPALIEGASAVFFTGGDQLRITSQIGDTPLFRSLSEFYRRGGVVVGTSAGAACMGETMLISGPGDESNRISSLGMASGFGFVKEIIVDTHFAERGRIGRLLGAVAQNPRNLGVGIDEDTAIVVEGEKFRVLGSGAVYVVDGRKINYSSLSEKNPEGVLSLYGVLLHVLADGDQFDLISRGPVSRSQKSGEE